MKYIIFFILFNISLANWNINFNIDQFDNKKTIKDISTKNINKGMSIFTADNNSQWILKFINLNSYFGKYSAISSLNVHTIKAKIDDEKTFEFRGSAWDNSAFLYLTPKDKNTIKFINQLKNGKILKIGILKNNESKIVFEIPLKGFSKAYAQLPYTIDKNMLQKNNFDNNINIKRQQLPIKKEDEIYFKTLGYDNYLMKKYKIDFKTLSKWKKIIIKSEEINKKNP